tara:strand:+ start:17609 stop:17821 length:213 start_codon:yes stop_codon:yes gene_type:complete
MNKSLENMINTKGQKSAAIMMGILSGIIFLMLFVYLVIIDRDTAILWPLNVFTGTCLGLGSGESIMDKKT